ncbi:hypothetical protein [Halomarina ordinaria]|uniref:Uncharacterized protein n=1 Tax=Halomarina ordinaria TaxID=3033939 RepID=A0ABD5U806_9EURY|nr:hypothetical protein [Halomarina sp. PSRA2]
MRRRALSACALAALVLLAGCSVVTDGGREDSAENTTPADVPTDNATSNGTDGETPGTNDSDDGDGDSDAVGAVSLVNRDNASYEVEVYAATPAVETVNVTYRNGTVVSRSLPADANASVRGNVSLVTPASSLEWKAYSLDPEQSLNATLRPPVEEYSVVYVVYGERYYEGATPVRFGRVGCASNETVRNATVAVGGENVTANATCAA